MKNKTLIATVISFACLLIVFTCGCGGGGSGGGASSGAFQAGIVPVRISKDSGGAQDGIFAYVGGNGVTGGWIENSEGVKISGSDLKMNYTNMRYEITLWGSALGSFRQGDYILKYTEGGETKSLLCQNLSWTPLQNTWSSFESPSYDYDSRTITVNFRELPGDQVKYYLRLITRGTDWAAWESHPRSSTGGYLTEYISLSGEYEVQLIADVYENGNLVRRYMHIFSGYISL